MRPQDFSKARQTAAGRHIYISCAEQGEYMKYAKRRNGHVVHLIRAEDE